LTFSAERRRFKSANAITIDESTGKVFLDAGSLARSNGSLKNRTFSFAKVFNLFD